jgi:hypothetical protein
MSLLALFITIADGSAIAGPYRFEHPDLLIGLFKNPCADFIALV